MRTGGSYIKKTKNGKPELRERTKQPWEGNDKNRQPVANKKKTTPAAK